MKYDADNYYVYMLSYILEGINNGEIIPLSFDYGVDLKSENAEDGWPEYKDTGVNTLVFKWKTIKLSKLRKNIEFCKSLINR